MALEISGSDTISRSGVPALFKSTPVSGWTFAYTIAQDKAHELNSELRLDRFSTGYLLDEKGIGTKTWIG